MTGDDTAAGKPSDSPTPNADAVGIDILSGAGNEIADPVDDPAPAKKAAKSS